MNSNPDSIRNWQRRTKERQWAKKQRQQAERHFAKGPAPKPRKPLRKQSKAQAKRLVEYQRVRIEFLAMPENAHCGICKARREAGERLRVNLATEVHHRAGRGKKLCDTTDFIPSCRPCREWPHENPRRARELNLLR